METEIDIFKDTTLFKKDEDPELEYLRAKIRQLESHTDVPRIVATEEKSVNLQVCELLAQFNELQEEKAELDNRFSNENMRFFDLVEKLRSKLKLIALSTIEMESKIRIFKDKMPELEHLCKKQDKTIDNLVCKFRCSNFDDLKELDANIHITEENIKMLEKETFKAKKRNKNIHAEIDTITLATQNLNTKFEDDQMELKEIIRKLEIENTELEHKIDQLVCVNKESLGQNLSKFQKEFDALSSQIKKIKKEKYILIESNEKLKNVVKKIILQQVTPTNN